MNSTGHRVAVRMSALLIAGVLVGATLGCGRANSGESGNDSSQSQTGHTQPARGGDLTVLYNGDVDNLDPGISYYQYGFVVTYTTQRPLYSFKPDDATKPVPDLAESDPQISADGKTVTVKIRTGVKFSPPVNREVTSDDVRYGIERGFTKQVAGPYVGAYLGDLKGVKAFQSGAAKRISGIETPDDSTLIFHLTRPRGAIAAGSLALPASAPVPREYAAKYDLELPSKYGQYQVATGPYMIANDASGKLTGYKPGREIRLVRNPNWVASTDYKPAYLDSITIKEGSDPEVASRQILSGESLVSGDFQLPPNILQQVSQGKQKDLLELTPPTGRYRYVALNTRVAPFNNVDARRAIAAVFDRTALRQAFGGPITGDIPTHWIPPGQPSFDEAGGDAGPGVDFLAKPEGDLNLAMQYMRKAGFSSGKYEGGKTFTAIADSATQQRRVAEVTQQQFAKLGFDLKTRFVSRDTMLTKYCQVPAQQPDVCPSVGWLKDFADPETMLDLVFNGKNILQTSNSNMTLFDDKALNAAMDKAEVVNDPAQRLQAWGQVDKMVTDLAPGVPWLWDKQPMLHSSNVNGVVNQANAVWDLMFTSIG